MSWRRQKYESYNRQEDREALDDHIESYEAGDHEIDHNDCSWCGDYYKFCYCNDADPQYGYMTDMSDYHMFKMVTLLRKFNIHAAFMMAKDRGW